MGRHHAEQARSCPQAGRIHAATRKTLESGRRHAERDRIDSPIGQHGQIDVAAWRGFAASMAPVKPDAEDAMIGRGSFERLQDLVAEVGTVDHGEKCSRTLGSVSDAASNAASATDGGFRAGCLPESGPPWRDRS